MTATHDVFISHSSQDRDVAEAALEAIEQAGHRCWIAPRDIVPGQNYGEAIIDGIRSSRIFLLIVSNHSVASQQVERETERAASAGLAIIPFRIEDVKPTRSLEFFISAAHWLDAFEPPMERHYAYLTEVVGQLLARKDATPPEAPRTPSVPTPRKRTTRRPSAALIGGVLAVVAVGGAASWWAVGRGGGQASCLQGDYSQRATMADESKPLNLRSRPSLESRAVTVIPAGESFCVAPGQEEWLRARLRTGETGYVLRRRISLIVPQGAAMPDNAQQQAPGNAAAPAQENKQ